MRWLLLMPLFAVGCRFAPTVDGVNLVECRTNDDCPQDGHCVGSLCVPRQDSLEVLRIVELTSPEQWVEAGDACSFTLTTNAERAAGPVAVQWEQLEGPSMDLASGTIEGLELPTQVGYVGNYTVGVTLTNDVDPPVSAEATCTTLVTTSAAFIVEGESGTECSMTNPCGSLADAGNRSRYYFGVTESDRSKVYPVAIASSYIGREIHGGFVHPTWKRDVEHYRTTLVEETAVPQFSLRISCSDCTLSGLYENPGAGAWVQTVVFQGANITFRDSVVLIDSVRTGNVVGVEALPAATGLKLERVVVRSLSTTETTHLYGIRFVGGQELDSAVVDLTAADSVNHKTGLWLDGNSAPMITRPLIQIGEAIDTAVGIGVGCANPTVHNAIVDLRREASTTSIAVDLNDASSCTPSGTFHSSIFVGGAGNTSIAINLDDADENLRVSNCILDAGDGHNRHVITLGAAVMGRSLDFNQSLLVLHRGADANDHFLWQNDAAIDDIEEIGNTIGCEQCLATSSWVRHVSRGGGDFRLTVASDCCINQGAALGPNDPRFDFDGEPRPVDQPSIGPFEYVP